MTTGGTESIIMAVKAFRDYARDVKGITRPNIVAPVTAHVAFNKAGLYFGVHVHSVKLNPETYTVDIKAMERAINRNTIMVRRQWHVGLKNLHRIILLVMNLLFSKTANDLNME